jgi:hypothetical protein
VLARESIDITAKEKSTVRQQKQMVCHSGQLGHDVRRQQHRRPVLSDMREHATDNVVPGERI